MEEEKCRANGEGAHSSFRAADIACHVAASVIESCKTSNSSAVKVARFSAAESDGVSEPDRVALRQGSARVPRGFSGGSARFRLRGCKGQLRGGLREDGLAWQSQV